MCTSQQPIRYPSAWVAGSCAVAAAIGVVAWHGIPEMIALSALVPPIVFRQRARRLAFLVALAYYAAASWPILPGVFGYFGSTATWMRALLFWLIPSLLLPLPWALCWSAEIHSVLWRLPLAYLLTVIPPVGIIGWASPLTAAGIAFPGWGWFGLLAFVALSAWACASPLARVVAAGLVIQANVLYSDDPAPPEGWEGVETVDSGATPLDPLPEFEAAERAQRIAVNSRSRVLVFPESVVPRWTEATDLFWHRTIEYARANGKTLLIGAGLPVSGTLRYRNAVLTRGASVAPPFFERVPVPVVMWNPFDPQRSVPLELFGPGILEIAGQRAAVLVCYEQLLTWPILSAAFDRPTLIVGLANDHWAKGTPIAAAQRAAVTAWARLFRLPKILAVNR